MRASFAHHYTLRDGKIESLDRQLLSEVLSPLQLEELDDTGELNLAVSIQRVGSFRISPDGRSLVVSLEAIFLSSFILISQNYEMRITVSKQISTPINIVVLRIHGT